MKNISFVIALDQNAHQAASVFAAQQITIAKGRRVYLNTLAICAVQKYLKFVCQLELKAGDAWQPSCQSIMDIADLVIPAGGKIECRPVLPGETEIMLPPESIEDRTGYVAVQFSEKLDQVQLLGFTEQLLAGAISIDQLLPLENLIDLVLGAMPRTTTNLSEVLAGVLNNGWGSIAALVPKSIDSSGTAKASLAQQEMALRNVTLSHSPYENIRAFTAGKVIDLKVQLGNISLLILIGLNKEPDGRIKVRVRLYSAGTEMQLPPNLQLTLQDGNGKVVGQVKHVQPMNFIQLNYFRLESGTRFDIQVSLANRRITESFIA